MWLYLVGPLLFVIMTIAPRTVVRMWRTHDLGTAVPEPSIRTRPPASLGPVEVAAAWEGTGIGSRALAAAMLDLAVRGWIVLAGDDVERDSMWRGLSVRQVLPEPRDRLRDWEDSLLDQLFGSQSIVKLNPYDQALARFWFGEFPALVLDAESSGRRNPSEDAPARRWHRIFMQIIPMLGVLISAISLMFVSIWGILAGLGLTFGSLIGGLAARSAVPVQQTPQSADFISQTLGFRRLFAEDPREAHRQLQRLLGGTQGFVFGSMLPYAVIFSLEDAWLSAFEVDPGELAAVGLDASSFDSARDFVIAVERASGILDSDSESLVGAMVQEGILGAGLGLVLPLDPT